ncbi:Uroporphyrinogen-III methyltransferase [Arthrobacter sp. 9V]|uniref:uroporphyrinogen-III synthase n=1 Tax=Arthrobacter sp. 9V TaxID=2653132 RepID=UPI0012F2953F|nr:uroporphyrinogen-III synthase [Arthrobacter sp. 9V]VXB01885.1 Uroporphyrinogen-III methyltransferase [Arthrobacter sp. 9V]
MSGLAGRRVLITRTAHRARPLAALLSNLGAEPLVLPLIDFEQAGDQAPLEEALGRLKAGAFDWLVISSITTVRVLLEKAAQRGMALADLVPSETKVATIGPSSREVLESVGLTVSLAPTDVQSAEGLLAAWKAAPERVFLPQADIAAPGLRGGLAAKGADVTTVVAYRTVDYPARAELRLTTELPSDVVISVADAPKTLSPEQARAALDAGTVDAVVAASPSAARRIAATLQPLGRCRLIAIGRPTAAEASRLGLTVAATAKVPTPDGIVAALQTVFANEGNPQ